MKAKPREFKTQIILDFIARFGNPDDEEVDLCSHDFAAQIFDFFMLNIGEGLLNCIEKRQELQAASDELAKEFEIQLQEFATVEDYSGHTVMGQQRIRKSTKVLANYRKLFPEEK